jgi:hypothetical protein
MQQTQTKHRAKISIEIRNHYARLWNLMDETTRWRIRYEDEDEDDGMIVKPPILEEPIPPEKNDTTGVGIIGEALRLPFVMFGDRVSARSLTALSR